MIYLTNAASSIIARAVTQLTPPDFGSKFQDVVCTVLRKRSGLNDLYENRGAGQPDAYSQATSFGFEVKCRKDSIPLVIEENSKNAMGTFAQSRFIVLITVDPPQPLFVINPCFNATDGTSLATADIRFKGLAAANVDGEFEAWIRPELSRAIEAIGEAGLSLPRSNLQEQLKRYAIQSQ